jgi:hypothetical protein
MWITVSFYNLWFYCTGHSCGQRDWACRAKQSIPENCGNNMCAASISQRLTSHRLVKHIWTCGLWLSTIYWNIFHQFYCLHRPSQYAVSIFLHIITQQSLYELCSVSDVPVTVSFNKLVFCGIKYWLKYNGASISHLCCLGDMLMCSGNGRQKFVMQNTLRCDTLFIGGMMVAW